MGRFSQALTKAINTKKSGAIQRPNKAVGTFSAAIEASEAISAPLSRSQSRSDITFDKSASVAPVSPMWNLDPTLQIFAEQNTLAGESIRMLRAKTLLQIAALSPLRIMVTSAQPNEGKTTIAASLAIHIANVVKQEVILVDGDLRNPSLHKLFGTELHHGVCECLIDGATLTSCLVSTPVERLKLLTAGRVSQNPSELASGYKMEQLLSEFKGRYVILDAPPAQIFSDTAHLASSLDGVLMVVRSGTTTKPALLQAIDNIGRDKILGLIFNATSKTMNEYQYYSYDVSSHNKKE